MLKIAIMIRVSEFLCVRLRRDFFQSTVTPFELTLGLQGISDVASDLRADSI